GDSGGPLSRVTGTDAAGAPIADALLGITSFGRGCADPSFPGIYTNVADPKINAFVTQPTPASKPVRRTTGALVDAALRARLRGEVPRTRVASRDRIVPSRVLQRVALVAQPQTGGWSGGGHLLGGQGLAGHGGPEEAGELAGDGDVGDGGALAVAGEVAVAVVQAHLGAEGAGGDVGRDVRGHGGDALADARRVLVVRG